MLRVKDDNGVQRAYLLKGDGKRLVFAQDRERPIRTPLTSRTHFITQLMTMRELKCVVTLAGSTTQYQVNVPLKGFREAADPIMGAYKKREAEEKEKQQEVEAAAQEMADKRLAEKKAKDEIARRRKEPMLFETKDKQFSTRGLFMGSTKTHVRFKRSDNRKDITVKKSLLSKASITEISLREAK